MHSFNYNISYALIGAFCATANPIFFMWIKKKVGLNPLNVSFKKVKKEQPATQWINAQV